MYRGAAFAIRYMSSYGNNFFTQKHYKHNIVARFVDLSTISGFLDENWIRLKSPVLWIFPTFLNCSTK